MNNTEKVAEAPAGGVLEPVGLDSFFSNYWEQKPLHIARPETNPFDSLISIADIEALLSTSSLSYPTVQLSHAGQPIPASDYTDDDQCIVANRLVEHYRGGSTIVISHAHRLVTHLMTLCRAIQASFMMRCQTNVYLSPAGNQGFNPHYDTHDVFILQVSGKKTFNFYSSGASFPTSADRFNSQYHAVGEKTEEIVLGAGDTLYIPRGVIHDAVADVQEPSLHVTLGVYPVLLHTLINEITQVAVETDPRLRRAISQSAWMQKEGASETTQLIQSVLAQHVQPDVVKVAMERLRDDMTLDALQDSRGMLSKSAPSRLKPETNIVVDKNKILRVEHKEHALKLCTFGQIVHFSEPLDKAVEWILKQGSMQPKDIPSLDQAQQLALVEQLAAIDVVNPVTSVI